MNLLVSYSTITNYFGSKSSHCVCDALNNLMKTSLEVVIFSVVVALNFFSNSRSVLGEFRDVWQGSVCAFEPSPIFSSMLFYNASDHVTKTSNALIVLKPIK